MMGMKSTIKQPDCQTNVKEETSMRKKGLAMLLTLAMLLGMLPTTALAAGPEDPMESQTGETAEVETVTVDTSDADLPDNDVCEGTSKRHFSGM